MENIEVRRLPLQQIRAVLAKQGESFDEAHVSHYRSISELAETVRSQKNWSMGEVFSCAIDADRFLVMKQVAPASCEMLTISQQGFHDVLTAYRYSQADLVAQLSAYAGCSAPVTTNAQINREFLETTDAKVKAQILDAIALLYGVTPQGAFEAVVDPKAKHLLYYLTEPTRSSTRALMLQNPGEQLRTDRRNEILKAIAAVCSVVDDNAQARLDVIQRLASWTPERAESLDSLLSEANALRTGPKKPRSGATLGM